jgi:hypothetical protein
MNAVAGDEIPVYLIEIGPHHLCRLVGRAVHFLHDPATPSPPLALVEIVDEVTRCVPTAFESHAPTGVFSRVVGTLQAGVCMACLDRSGRHIAYILVDEID